MAQFTDQVSSRFAVGATVGAYKRSNWAASQLPASGAPQGSADASAAVTSAGTLTLTGLADNTHYLLTNSSGTPGSMGYLGVVTPSVGSVRSELGYVEKTDADFATSAVNTPADVTGLTVTVTVDGTRPIDVEAGGSTLKESAVTGIALAQLVQVTGGPTVLMEAQCFGAANELAPWAMRRRLSLAAGTYTFKVQLQQNSGAGTATIVAKATAPAWLQVTQL